MSVALALAASLFAPPVQNTRWCWDCDGCGNGKNAAPHAKGSRLFRRGHNTRWAYPCETCNGSCVLPSNPTKAQKAHERMRAQVTTREENAYRAQYMINKGRAAAFAALHS